MTNLFKFLIICIAISAICTLVYFIREDNKTRVLTPEHKQKCILMCKDNGGVEAMIGGYKHWCKCLNGAKFQGGRK